MNKTNTFIMTSILTTLSNISLAKCKLPEAPSIPFGTQASEIEIKASKIAVNAFIADITDYRLCIKKELDALGQTPPESAKAAWEKKHNNSVATEEYIANAFNTQLRLFKSKEEKGDNTSN